MQRGDLVNVRSRFDKMLGVILNTEETTGASKTFAKVLWTDGTINAWNTKCLVRVSEDRRLG